MIDFYIDARSGVPPYMQLIQQVRRALKLGMLFEGDQLPTVKEVVGRIAINPNTVSKAYRELEHEGLVSARAGVGTFIAKSLNESTAALAPLRHDLQRWVAAAREAGLDDEGIEALVRECFSGALGDGNGVSAVLETEGLTKHYRRQNALSDCSLEIPEGRVVGLVGPNGSGKSTLLNLAAGLIQPSSGTLRVLGRSPAESPAQLARVGFVAQNTPTYPGLSVNDHLRFGAHTNPSWDHSLAERRIEQLGLDLKRHAGKLSGGQRAQLALTLAIAKRPEVLILDEPVAALDPLARREFLQILMETVADYHVSVILSSHLVADVERVCDYLVILISSRVQVAGDVEELLASHHRLIGPREGVNPAPENQVIIDSSYTERQSTLLVRSDGPITDPAWTVEAVSLDDLVLGYMSQGKRGDRTTSPAPEVTS